jgi:hypothetical protein
MNPINRKLAALSSISVALIVLLGFSPLSSAVAQNESASNKINDVIARIIDEGINHSQAMTNLSYLCDVIGPRLTGSPNLKRANEWTRDKLASWGLTNGHLEAWGPFGRGWTLKKFSAQIVEPQAFNLIAYPNAWSPGLKQPLVANVVYFDARTNADLEKFKGKLKGAIVLAGPMREVTPRFAPMARRLVDTNLLELANAGEPRDGRARFQSPDELGGTNSFSRGGGGPGRRPRGAFPGRWLPFLQREGASLIVNESSLGDGGTVFVSAASVPRPGSETNASLAFAFGANATNLIRAWATNAPPIPPQITVASEDYNRMARMIQQGEKLKMAVDLKVKFNDDDRMAYNTIAEIPGTDLKDEIVMLGGHLDSWHSGTGATDNGAGVAATMEAVRIISALKLKPRRTIRIALWSGEEQGLYGSKAYVADHFGYFTNLARPSTVVQSNKEAGSSEATSEGSTNNTETTRKLVRGPEYDKLSIYFNLDNGAGKIRGVYLQGNEPLRPIFRRWLEPFRELGAETLALSNTGSTDHMSFDTIGLPGLEFLQDPLDYSTRSHHSNEDVFDRIQGDDLKQAATIIAAFAYNAAMTDEKMPRKPFVENLPRRARPSFE